MIEAPRNDHRQGGQYGSRAQGSAPPRPRAWCLSHPQPCLLCESYCDASVCAACAASLSVNATGCRACALPLAQAHVQTNVYCPECTKSPPSFSTSVIPWTYNYPLNHLIRRFKDHGDLVAGRWLSDSWCNVWLELIANKSNSIDAIVAVPCHPRQRFGRGFSPSEFIAERVSRSLKRPLIPALIKRTATPDQRMLDRRQRRANLANAFALNGQLPPKVERVLLIDDVVTTGATARITSDLLRRAGAHSITLGALARVSK